jgi:hypothetical protein
MGSLAPDAPGDRLAPFPVVCVLTSAGGREDAFFRNLPRETGMAFLVLLNHGSLEPEPYGSLPAREGDPVLPGQLLLVEPGMALGWAGDQLRLARKQPAQGHLLPGDILL